MAGARERKRSGGGASASLAARAALAVVASGAVYATLLSARHARLQAAHELSQARLRIAAHDARLLEYRSRVASLTSPAAVRTLMASRPEPNAFVPAADATERPEAVMFGGRLSPEPAAPLLFEPDPFMVPVGPAAGRAGEGT